jgi:WD40 repeat protein
VLTEGHQNGIIGNVIEYWDMTTTTRLWDDWDLLTIEWTPDPPLRVLLTDMRDQMLAFGGLDGYMDYDEYAGDAIHIWDAVQKTRLLKIAVNSNDEMEAGRYIVDIAFNSDGSILASSNADGTIMLWNVTDGNNMGEFNTGLEQTGLIAFSPDDRFLAILSEDVVLIWDVEQMESHVTLNFP